MGDAFGALLLAHLESGAGTGKVLEFVERDDGYLDAGDAGRYFAAPESWDAIDHWACDRAQGRILDVGSGAGRHSLYLQETGRDVTALDVSPLAAEVCRRRGVREVVTGTVFDLAQRGAGPFDSFLLLGNNLGLLGGAAHAPRVLAAFQAIATPEARIIAQSTNPYETQNPLHLGYHQRNRSLGRMAGQIRMRIRHQNLATAWFDYLFASVEELETLLAGSGWRLQEHQVAGPRYVAVLVRGSA
jgi:SAM-dependent methyltransferase